MIHRGSQDVVAGIIIVAVISIVFLCVAAGMWGCPQYKIYEQRSAGAAKLAEAESSRQITIQEAHAKMESAKMLAQAEIERARGVAEANRIIGESLGGVQGEAYLRYLWINGLESNNPTVIYVPTEANLPILEANRLHTEKP